MDAALGSVDSVTNPIQYPEDAVHRHRPWALALGCRDG